MSDTTFPGASDPEQTKELPVTQLMDSMYTQPAEGEQTTSEPAEAVLLQTAQVDQPADTADGTPYPVVTITIIGLNLLAYILLIGRDQSFFSHTPQALMDWGGNYKPAVLNGEWWRILTSAFLHINLLHFAGNMFALFDAGCILEKSIGRARFLFVYMATVVSAGLFSLWSNHSVVSVGASGAVFGVWGMIITLKLRDVIEFQNAKTFTKSLVIVLLLNLILGFSVVGIDNAAHMGGLLGGMVLGVALAPSIRRFNYNFLKYLSIFGFSFLILFGALIASDFMPNPIGKYNNIIAEYSRNEAEALTALNVPQDSGRAILIGAFNSGLSMWRTNLTLLHDLEGEDLPQEYRTRIHRLEDYTQLRIKSYELWWYRYSDDTTNYDKIIRYYNEQIQPYLNENQ